MADNTEIMPRSLTNSPEFVQELLPAAERTALLYHLSYLCLANFPKLERILRERAVETQLLFGSSKTVLLKCVTTSEDLVSSLLPMLKLAVQSNKTVLAVKSLEKARTWINEIVDKVKEIIDRYDQHNRNVASSTSDVITEKAATEKTKQQNSEQMKSLQESVDNFQKELKKIAEDVGNIEANIKQKNAELQSHVRDVCQKSQGMGILAALVPFVGAVIKSIYDTATAPGATAKTQALTNELSQLSSEKSDLRNKEWNIQIQLADYQLKLSSLKIQDGAIPDPVHLGDVQQCLSQIQQILIQLKTFWETVGEMLESLRKKTFVGEDILDDKNMSEETKNYFLKSIETAEEYWKCFGQGCLKAQSIFNLQTKDAYKFLESTPKIGSVEWKQEYETVMEKLKQISPDPFSAQKPKAIGN